MADESTPNVRALAASNLLAWAAQGLYLISPIDLIPDVIPFLGWADDVLLLGLCVGFSAYTFKTIRKAGGLKALFPNSGAKSRRVGTKSHLEPVPDVAYEPMSLSEIRSL